MERVGEHPVPAGPLAVRWLAYELDEQRAGVVDPRARSARERRLGAVALARSRGRAARVPLARPAREPDRLGRVEDGVPRGRAAGRERRARAGGGRAAAAGQLPARVRPRRGVPLLVPGASARRRSTSRSRCSRGSTSGGSRVASTARPIPSSRLRSRRRRSRSSPRTRSPSPTSSRARFPRPTGRGCSSTRTQRATRRSAAQSKPSRAAIDAGSPPWAPGGGRNPRFGEPLLLPSLLDGLEPETHEGLPAYAGQRRALRGPRRRQTSVAIRSSERLKTHAPTASATPAATTV